MTSKIGELIKAKREEQQLSQRELGRRAGIPSAHMSQIETGMIVTPAVETMWRIAAALGCSTEEIGGASPPDGWAVGYAAGLSRAIALLEDVRKAHSESHGLRL